MQRRKKVLVLLTQAAFAQTLAPRGCRLDLILTVSSLLGKCFSSCDDLTDPTQRVDIMYVTGLQGDADFWQVTEDTLNIF